MTNHIFKAVKKFFVLCQRYMLRYFLEKLLTIVLFFDIIHEVLLFVNLYYTIKVFKFVFFNK